MTRPSLPLWPVRALTCRDGLIGFYERFRATGSTKDTAGDGLGSAGSEGRITPDLLKLLLKDIGKAAQEQ